VHAPLLIVAGIFGVTAGLLLHRTGTGANSNHLWPLLIVA
jgi:hypothetical protein